MKRIVILGGGFGGLYTLNYLKKALNKSKFVNFNYKIQNPIKLELINEHQYFLFTPLFPEIATGSVPVDISLELLFKVVKNNNYKFIWGKVEKIDLDEKIIYFRKQVKNESLKGFLNKIHILKQTDFSLGQLTSISYDYLVIALGGKTNFYNIPGSEKYAYDLKSIKDVIVLKKHFKNMFDMANLYLKEKNNDHLSSKLNEYLTFVIVGGGPTGVEMAGEMSDLFYKIFKKFYSLYLVSKAKIILIEKSKDLISQFQYEFRQKALEILRNKKIEIYFQKSVSEVGKNFIKLETGEVIKTKTVIWTAGIIPNLPEILGKVEKDEKGRLIVNQFLQLKNYENVFALGDIACFIQNEKPLSQLAQVATKEARIVCLNILNMINNRPLRKFVYHHSGDLISIGHFYALGSIGKVKIFGFFAWFLWKAVYFFKIFSFKNKFKFLINWFFNVISRQYLD